MKLVQNVVAAVRESVRYQSEEAGKIGASGGQGVKGRLGPVTDEAALVKAVHEGSFPERHADNPWLAFIAHYQNP